MPFAVSVELVEAKEGEAEYMDPRFEDLGSEFTCESGLVSRED
jgi:hypothetical protein